MDVAARVGLTRVLEAGRPDKDHLLDSAGAGAAFLDFDKDGRLDVYLVNGWRLDGDRVVEHGTNALYHQRADGTFEDVTDRAGVAGEGEWGSGAFVADYDNDGWPDILVTTFGRNVLYRNLGDGRFENVAARAGIESPGWNTGAAFFDADGDGWLDLYIAQYVDCTIEDVLKAKRTLWWRGPGAGGLRALRPQGRSRPFLPQREGPVRGGHGSGGHEGPRPGLRLRRARRRLRRRRATPTSTWPTTPIPTTSIATTAAGTSRRSASRPSPPSTPTAPPRPAWGSPAATRTATGSRTSSSTNFSEDFATLYKGLGRAFFEDASRDDGRRAR